MSTINVKITDTGWLLTKGDKSISIKDNGDGKLANGDELSSELAGSGFTQQDILLVANELNNPQANAAGGKKKGNFWGNLQGFMSGFMGGISSMFTLGGLFGFGGGFFGGQDSWAFNGCGGVGFNDMRVWNYGLNSMWSGDIGYTGSTQGAYAVLNGGGLDSMLRGLYKNDDTNAWLNLTVKPQGNGEENIPGTDTGNGNGNITGAGNENGTGNGNGNITGAGNGNGTGIGDGNTTGVGNGNGTGNRDGDNTGTGNGNGSVTGNDGKNKGNGPRFYTGDDDDIAANRGNGNGAGGRKSITD